MSSSMSDYYELQCNYGKDGAIIYSKISLEDKEYILNLQRSWFFWKGGASVKCPGGYIRATINYENVYLHHIIMSRMGIPKPGDGYSIDHINRDKLDNRRENLRWASQSEQNANTGKRSRKHNARPLPDGITQDMLPKYVVYYKECYNKEKNLYREFFKVEKHPELDKPIIGSKSNKLTIQEKLTEIKEKIALIGKDESNDESNDEDEISKLMKKPPPGIQYNKATEKRGSRYVISRRITPEGKSDISSTGSKLVSDRDKFIEIYNIYKTL